MRGTTSDMAEKNSDLADQTSDLATYTSDLANKFLTWPLLHL
jgi:hypothetical protein